MNRRPIALVLTLLLVLPLGALAAPNDPAPPPEIFEHLPRDPLFVWASLDLHPAEIWDGLMAMAERFLPEAELEEMRSSIAGVEETLELSLRDDLLARIGPELAVVFDLPDFDQTAQSVMMGEAAPASIFGKVVLLVGSPEGEQLEKSIFQLANRLGADSTVAEGVAQLRIPLPDGSDGGGATEAAAPAHPAVITHLDVFFDSRDGLLVAGFDPDSVQTTLAGLERDGRLASGDDFRRVFSQLDQRPESMTYFNIPKLVSQITNSQMAGGMLAASEETRPMLELLNNPALTGMGVGSTSLTVEGAQRTTTYGASFLADTVQMGIVASIFVPNFLDALNKAKHKRTVADMGTVANALDGFSRSNDAYPGPTDGWVHLSEYRGVLEPEHVTELPTNDGWGHELMYNSDGSTYSLRSPGRDGVPGETPTIDGQESPDDAYDGDILLADGEFEQHEPTP